MENSATFCLCTDTTCALHPTNHDKGCTPCIRKNQQRGEIPSCFFRMAAPDIQPDAYYFEDFAEAVAAQHEKDKSGPVSS